MTIFTSSEKQKLYSYSCKSRFALQSFPWTLAKASSVLKTYEAMKDFAPKSISASIGFAELRLC